MKIGYIRVSTQEQNVARQEVLMGTLSVDEVYIDRMSGKNTNRRELQKMMEYVRKGDTVIVESISRFARNTCDLLYLASQRIVKHWHARYQNWDLTLGLSQILCKHRNAVQIEQNLFKAEVAQAAAALFSK